MTEPLEDGNIVGGRRVPLHVVKDSEICENLRLADVRRSGLPSGFHVASDLLHELSLRRERALLAEPGPELEDEPLPVEVALEVEEERLHPALLAAVVRVRPDRDCGAVPVGGAGIDPVRGDEERRVHVEVGGGVAERPAALVARDHDPLHLRRPPERSRGAADLAGVQEAPDLRRRDAVRELHRPHLEAQPREKVEVAVENAPVPGVHPVEGAERDGAAAYRKLLRRPGDPHRRSSAASASSRGITRSGSASSTSKGPTSVRRSVRQCPPSASAIARTYVPELTRRSSRTVSPVYAMTSSASTRERRSGISTATPRRASL